MAVNYEIIEKVLESLDIQNDIILSSRDQTFKLEEELKSTKKPNDSFIFAWNDDGNMPAALFINGKDIEKMVNARTIMDQVREIKNVEEVKQKDIFVFVTSIDEKIQAMSNIRQNLRAKYIFIPKDKGSQTHIVGIDTRINRIERSIDYPIGEKEDNLNGRIKSFLYVAKLFDLVNLYNTVGDTLFDKNVRAGISKDVTGVKTAIKDTLMNEPEKFWFFNNGITMIADKVSHYHSSCIEITQEKEGDCSVINGAQTLTACAEFFFKKVAENIEDKDGKTIKNPEYEALMNAKDKAFVLLRVVSANMIDDENKGPDKDIEKKVSISLNRQKPIDSEDLAYSVDLVHIINAFSDEVYDNTDHKKEMGNWCFRIVRKGETWISNSYTLVTLGQLLKASKKQQPGLAKNAYQGNMLKLERNHLKDTDIFVDFDTDNYEYDTLRKHFIAHYGLVNLSKKILDIWEKQKENSDLDKTKYPDVFAADSKIVGSGNYYFLSLITWALFTDCAKEKIIYSSLIQITDSEELEKAYNSIEVNACILVEAFYECIQEDAKKNGIYKMEELKSDKRYVRLFDDKENMEAFKSTVRNAVYKI